MAPEYGRMNFLDEVTVWDAWSKRIWVHMSGTKPFLDCGQQLGEGWAPPGFSALDTQDEKDNHRVHHTGSVVARISKDRACHRTHQGEGVKWATDDNNKLRTRSNISIGTWNVRTLRPPGKLEELTHEMRRYRWNVLGLYEVRWRNFGETTTQDGHKLYFSGKEDRHENGVGFLVPRTPWTQSWGASQFPAGSSPFVSGQHHLTSPLCRLMLQQQIMMMRK